MQKKYPPFRGARQCARFPRQRAFNYRLANRFCFFFKYNELFVRECHLYQYTLNALRISSFSNAATTAAG